MSFILDALKKSELERQRQVVPGLMDSRAAHGRTRLPLWAVGLMVLLGVNLAVLTVVLTWNGLPGTRGARPTVVAQPAVRQDMAPPAVGTAGSAAPDHFSPLDGAAAPVYAPEVPVTAGAGSGAAPVSPPAVAPPAVATAQGRGSTGRDPRRHDPLLTARDDKPDDEALPSISEINTGGQDPLPAMHLDVHVYATDPADRFVYINMHKYREGATLAEGPTVERIRRDGVVLDFHGLRFVLPRQQ